MFRHPAIRRGTSAVVVAFTLALFYTAPAAEAATTTAKPTLSIDAKADTSGKVIAHVEVEMKYDCAAMTGEVLKTVIAQGNCPSGGVTTNDTTVGNCGSSYVDVLDSVPLDGLGTVRWGMTSYQAPIFVRNVILDYVFTTIDQGLVFGSLYDVGFVLAQRYDAVGTATSPLPSLLSVIMGGQVTLVDGVVCFIIPPRGIARIS
jgi:hypothetical protein